MSVARTTAYEKYRFMGVYSANDIRRLENMNPLPEGQGDDYLVPLNMIDAQQLGKVNEPKPEQKLLPEPQKLIEEASFWRIRESALQIFAESLGRVLRKEEKSLEKHAKRADFEQIRTEFIEHHKASMFDTLRASIKNYLEQVRFLALLSREIAIKEAEIDPQTEQILAEWIEFYSQNPADSAEKSAETQGKWLLSRIEEAGTRARIISHGALTLPEPKSDTTYQQPQKTELKLIVDSKPQQTRKRVEFLKDEFGNRSAVITEELVQE